MADTWFQRLQRLALVPKGVRSKLVVSFLLMSVIPLCVLLLVAVWFAFPYVRDFYHLEQWFPLIANPAGSSWWIFLILVMTTIVSLLGGLYLAVKLVEPVILLTHEAKHLAEGDYDRQLPAASPNDELGDLTFSLNRLTSRIRDNMIELKTFGERTKQINFEIHKRMVMLSGLFQIGELISSGTELETVLDLVVEKLALLENGGFSFLILQPVEELPLTRRRAHRFDVSQLDQLVFQSAQALIDAKNPPSDVLQDVWEQLGRPNLILQPVTVRNRPIGMLAVGNRNEDFAWSAEWVDLVGVFVKQTSIAVENELLLRKTKALAIRDELTGVYNETYVRQRLAEEIKRAVMYQRPCAFVMFVLDGFDEYRRRHGGPEAERALKKVARVIQESVTDIDRVGRFNTNELVVLLPERNKRQAFEVAEEIRKRVGFAFAEVANQEDRLTLLMGISENPLDGMTAEELVEKAMVMLRKQPQSVSTSG